MSRNVCPFLGALDADRNRDEHVEYPSFENRCWATAAAANPAADMLMLTDQATYCLGQSHQLCPRYVAAQAARGKQSAAVPAAAAAVRASSIAERGTKPEFASDWLTTDLHELEDELASIDEEEAARRRVWGWLAAGTIFLMVFAVGSLLAVYAGWNYVRDARATADGGLETLAAAQINGQVAPEPGFIVVTATVPPVDTATPTPGAVMVAPPNTPNPAFPPAVTATPDPAGSSGDAPGANSGEVIVVNPNVQTAPPAGPPNVELPTQPFDLEQTVPTPPTRRPTPTFEIPTSTPLPLVESSPTPAPILGPPVVVFKPDNRALERDQCTTVRWAVQNVREVYYEGIGVNGTGEREVCVDNQDELFQLMIVLPSGVSEVYTTTVRYIAPTPTASYTPTVTPTPYHTPTWTPEAPTATPTPNLTFGVSMGIEGSTQQSCAAGGSCTISLVITNQGSGTDNLTATLGSGNQWSPQLCRVDGVCSNNAVTISNVGPNNIAYVNFVVNVPGDAQGQRAEYTFVGASGATNNAVRSEPVTLTIQVP